VRGRLTVQKVNDGIDELVQIVQEKYRILSLPCNKMGGRTLKKYQEYAQVQKTAEKGEVFFCEEDIRATQHLKADATGKAIIAVLRHLGRLKEAGGRAKRFILIPS